MQESRVQSSGSLELKFQGSGLTEFRVQLQGVQGFACLPKGTIIGIHSPIPLNPTPKEPEFHCKGFGASGG